MTITQGDGATSARIEGIDAWRAALMLGGLFVHATLWQEPRAFFTLVNEVSHAFRMGAFFGISGFLAAVTLRRRSRREWLRGRTLALGVPAAFGISVLSPLVYLLVVGFGPTGAGGTPPLPFDWHHLWFLVALLLYAPIACALDRWDARRGALDRIVRPFCSGRRPMRVMMLAVAGISGMLMALAAVVIVSVAPTAWLGPLANARLIAGYLPMYLMGFALSRCCGLRDAMLADWKSPALLLFLIVCGQIAWYGMVAAVVPVELRVGIDALIPLTTSALCPPAAFLLIVRSCLAIRRVPRAIRRLSDASYTIYLVHLPMLVAINLGFARVGWNPYLEYAVAIAVATAASYLLHRLVIRSAVLSLLLNGKPPRRRPGAATAPA